MAQVPGGLRAASGEEHATGCVLTRHVWRGCAAQAETHLLTETWLWLGLSPKFTQERVCDGISTS